MLDMKIWFLLRDNAKRKGVKPSLSSAWGYYIVGQIKTFKPGKPTNQEKKSS